MKKNKGKEKRKRKRTGNMFFGGEGKCGNKI